MKCVMRRVSTLWYFPDVSMVLKGLAHAVIKQCALERDLSLFDAGDKTEVGEKGITLRYTLFTDQV